MATYRVDALEKFLVRTTYFVEADGSHETGQLCSDGKAAYESHQVEGAAGDWVETLSVEPEEPLRLVGPTNDSPH